METIGNILNANNLGTKDVEQMSKDAEAQLKAKATGPFGSDTAQHAADVLKAQRKLITSKDLGDRFQRIATQLEKIKRDASGTTPSVDIKKFQAQMENIRPLMRLLVREEEFRTLLVSALKVARNVVGRLGDEVEGSVDKVLDKGEKKGFEAGAKEAKDAMEKTADNIQKKLDKDEKLISDSEWQSLSSQLDNLFTKIQSHKEWRNGVDQLFSLGSMLASDVQEAKEEVQDNSAVQEVKEETKDLIAQFSGEKELDKLMKSVNELTKKFEKNDEATKWWAEFSEHTQRVAKDYQGEKDVEKFRDFFQRGLELFDEFRPKINKIIDNMNDIMSNIANDEYILKLRESLGAVADDLYWQDKDGNRHVDTNAAGLLLSTVTDVIKQKFQGLPLPRVERNETDYSYSLDNLSLTANLPDKMDFHLESYASLDTAQMGIAGQSSLQTEIYLTVSIKGITAQVPNIYFTYRSPTITENGVMTVSVPEPGADLTLELVMRPIKNAEISALAAPTKIQNTTGADKEGFQTAVGGGMMRYEFVKIRSHFSIPTLDIDYDKSTLSHQYLVPLMTRLWKARIVDRFETAIEGTLNDGLASLGDQIVGVLNKAENPLSISSMGSTMFTTL